MEKVKGLKGEKCIPLLSLFLTPQPVARNLTDLGVNLLQIRLDGPDYTAFLVNRTTIALQNRQNLSSPSLIFALIS